MGRIRETGRRAWHLATVRLTARPVQVGLSVLGAVFIVALFTVAKSHGYDLYAYWTIDLADPVSLADQGHAGRRPGLVCRAARVAGARVGRFAVTAAAVVVSVVVMGIGVWEDWLGILTSSAGIEPPSDALPIPLLPRVLGAGLIAAFGGLTDRRWLVPVAFTLAMPTLWVIALAPLVALAAGTVRRETPS